jgi:RsiW-degrading membrane proteinase PrsW (M82 family)
VIATALVFFAGIVPFIEELIKPIGVWLFASRLDSPAQGFALGALSGAAFTLIETFGSSAQVSEWVSLLTGRIGTSLLHITSTALMGWGITLVWKQRQYVKLFLLYLGSCLMHAAWNGTVILYSLSIIATEADSSDTFGALMPVTFGISILLVLVMFVILTTTNRKLNKTETPALPNSTESLPA